MGLRAEASGSGGRVEAQECSTPLLSPLQPCTPPSCYQIPYCLFGKPTHNPRYPISPAGCPQAHCLCTRCTPSFPCHQPPPPLPHNALISKSPIYAECPRPTAVLHHPPIASKMHTSTMSTHTLRAERILCTSPLSLALLVFKDERFLSIAFSMSSMTGFCLQ